MRINGLHGRIDEDWAATEQKVRSFLINDLEMPEMEHVDLERAHRIKSTDQNKCTVIVKFNRFKDREAVLKKAAEILDDEAPYTVRRDFTQRVKKHRRELGKEMIAAKARGQQARIKFDKLEIDGDLYRYDAATEEIVLIPSGISRTRGRAHGRGRARAGSGDTLRHMQAVGGLVDRLGEHGDDNAGNQSETEGRAMGGPDDVFSLECGRGADNNGGFSSTLNTCVDVFVNILTWNIEGLHKYQDNTDLKNYFMKFDIVALCETWGNFVGDFDNFLRSYLSFDCVRKKKTGAGRNIGGICVFVKGWLTRKNVVKRIFPNFNDCVVLLFKGSIFQSMQDIILYFVYVSPQGSRIYDNLAENNED